MNISIPVQVCEFLNFTPIIPLISRCEIKVCWVGDTPNRNGTVITKEAAEKMAPSLPGCPIVGYYNKDIKDFETHNEWIEIEDGEIKFVEATKPYGFVDLHAKVWFQHFVDFDGVEREYLVTEGYLWTEIYEESKRVVEKGNNQSMELHKKTLEGNWAKNENFETQFFIINDGLFEKLCILGENFEPCFEGSQIKSKFSLDPNLKNALTNMVNELKSILSEGGPQMIVQKYALEVGDSNWEAIFNLIDPIYKLMGVYSNEDNSLFALVSNRETEELYSIGLNLDENSMYLLSENIEAYTEELPEDLRFSLEAIDEYEAKKKEDQQEDPKPEDNDDDDSQNQDDNDDEEEDINKKYELLLEKYNALELNHNDLVEKFNLIEQENNDLKDFKFKIDKNEKLAMIDKFYMLSDEDKSEVVQNIDNYSLEDIESKLSVICFRNKVDFSLDSDKEDKQHKQSTVFNLNNVDLNSAPAWIQAVEKRRKK